MDPMFASRLQNHRKLLAGVVAFMVGALLLLLTSRDAFARGAQLGEPKRLEVEGQADAFYYRPRGSGARPVIMYLHGRGGNAAEDCRKWAKVATEFGWVVCPQGPEDRGAGARGWANGAPQGKLVVDAVLAALHAKYKSRVRTRNNILMGFSEGAFIAQQVGLMDPKTWGRWLILAASDQYWMGDTAATLKASHGKLRRVFLLTGENDGVLENTIRVGDTLKDNKIPVKVKIVPGMGHEIPADRMVSLYRRPLAWLAAAR
jgi:predicted esterase